MNKWQFFLLVSLSVFSSLEYEIRIDCLPNRCFRWKKCFKKWCDRHGLLTSPVVKSFLLNAGFRLKKYYSKFYFFGSRKKMLSKIFERTLTKDRKRLVWTFDWKDNGSHLDKITRPWNTDSIIRFSFLLFNQYSLLFL